MEGILNIRLLYQMIVIIAMSNFVQSSMGNRLRVFQICLTSNKLKCEETGYPAVLPWQLRIFGWSCIDEVKYQCMHNTTSWVLGFSREIYQYYGKWPFVRLLGIQEPASTIFSLGNLAAHVLGWKVFSSTVSREYLFYQPAKLYFLVNINSWIWSAVFHTRDLDVTEKLDYYCASLVVMSSILFCYARIVGDPNCRRCFLCGSVLAAIYAYHVYSMAFVKFDYGYNMKFNIAIGTINLLMWLWWCFRERKTRTYVWKCAVLVITLYLCVGLEVLDFPPIWWTFDAHSLWHLATIPLCYFWYHFLIDDGQYEISFMKKL